MAFESSDYFNWPHDVDGLQVLDGTFVTVTADGAEDALYDAVMPLLQRIRVALELDVVFVAHLIAGVPYVRRAPGREQRQTIVAARADAMEAAVGKTVLQDRGAAGPYLALPVVAKNGHEFGTVCCRVQKGRTDLGPGAEAEALYSVARLVALALAVRPVAEPVNVWESSAAAPLGLEAAAR